jgi:hypothetical protein
MNRIEAIAELKSFTKASNAAWKVLMNDPRVMADKTATHTPELLQAWNNAADAERMFREKHELCDYPNRRRSN